jgi:hypothetical protein
VPQATAEAGRLVFERLTAQERRRALGQAELARQMLSKQERLDQLNDLLTRQLTDSGRLRPLEKLRHRGPLRGALRFWGINGLLPRGGTWPMKLRLAYFDSLLREVGWR